MRFLIGLVLLIIVAIATKNPEESGFLWGKIIMLVVLFIAVLFLGNYLNIF